MSVLRKFVLRKFILRKLVLRTEKKSRKKKLTNFEKSIDKTEHLFYNAFNIIKRHCAWVLAARFGRQCLSGKSQAVFGKKKGLRRKNDEHLFERVGLAPSDGKVVF